MSRHALQFVNELALCSIALYLTAGAVWAIVYLGRRAAAGPAGCSPAARG